MTSLTVTVVGEMESGKRDDPEVFALAGLGKLFRPHMNRSTSLGRGRDRHPSPERKPTRCAATRLCRRRELAQLKKRPKIALRG
jgi:hypothetical protein